MIFPSAYWSFQISPFLYFYVFIGYAGSLLLHRLFSVKRERRLLSSCGVQASHCGGFSCRGARALVCGLQKPQHLGSVLRLPGSRAPAQELRWTGLVTPQHVGSSRTRGQTCVSYIGRWILYHWASREATDFSFCKVCSHFNFLLCCLLFPINMKLFYMFWVVILVR